MALTVAGGSGVFTTNSANTGNVVLQGNLLKIKFPIASDKTQYDYTKIQYHYRYSYQPIYVGGSDSAAYVYYDNADSATTQAWANLPNSIITSTDCTFLINVDTFNTDMMLTFSVRATDDYSSVNDVIFTSSSAVFAITNRAAKFSISGLSWGSGDTVFVTGEIEDTGFSLPANASALTTGTLATQWGYWRNGLNTVLKNNNSTTGDISFSYWYQYGKTLPLSSPVKPDIISGVASFNLTDTNWFASPDNEISFQIENLGYPSNPQFTSNSSYYFQFDLRAADQDGNTTLNQGGIGAQMQLPASFNELSTVNYLLSAVPAFQIKKGCVKTNLPKANTSKVGGGMFSHSQEQGDAGHSIALYDHHVNSGESASADNPSIGFFNTEGVELANIKYNGQLMLEQPSGTGAIATKLEISQYTIPRRTGSGSGEADSYMEYSENASADTVARRKSSGTLSVAGPPTDDEDAVNKLYLEEQLANISTDSIRIPAGSDLNNYNTVGMYYSPVSADAITMSNLPQQIAFSLLVEKHAGTKQTFTAYVTTNPTTWIRNRYSTTWGPWAKVITSLDILDLTYPVGSMYISKVNTSPATLFGGTWVAITDRMIMAASATYPIDSTGGSATHTLTTAEMPVHTHTQNSHNHTQNSHAHTQAAHSHVATTRTTTYASGSQTSWRCMSFVGTSSDYAQTVYTGSATPSINGNTATNQATTATNNNTGSGSAHNNLPPYLARYMWERTA